MTNQERNPEPTTEPEAEGEIGERVVEVEKEPLPWERLTREDEDRFIGRYEDEAKLSTDTRRNIDSTLQQESDRTRIDFARDWYSNNNKVGGIIKERGYDADSTDEGYIVRVTKELGGFEELKTENQYQKVRERIDNLSALRMDLQKEKIPLDSQFLILNVLNKRAERLKEEISAIKDPKKGSPEFLEKKALEREKERLFQLRKELSESITGRDLEKEAEKEEFKPRSSKVSSQEELLENLGYIKKRRGILKGVLKKKIMIVNREGEVVGEFRKEGEVNKFLKREVGVRNNIEGKIQALGVSPEKATGGIEEVYARVKNRLKVEFIEQGLKKEKKTRGQLEQLKEEFEGKGKNPTDLIDAALQRKGLEGLTESWKDGENRKKINSFLGEWGISIDDMDYRLGRMAEKGMTYEKAVRKEIGFIEWLLELIFTPPRPKK